MQIITSNVYLANGFSELFDTLDRRARMQLHRFTVIEIRQLEELPLLFLDIYRNKGMHITEHSPVLLLTDVPGILHEKRMKEVVLPLSMTLPALKKKLMKMANNGTSFVALMQTVRLCFGYEPLTDREVEIANLLATGLCMKQIAYNLHISPKTAYGHGRSLREKVRLSGLNRLTQVVTRYDGQRTSRYL